MRFDIENRATLVRKKADHLPDILLSDIQISHVIGQGGFGRVFLGTLQQTGEQFAIKSIRKDKLVHHRETILTVNIEYQVLFEGNNPFLCSMQYYFSTDERLYFVMPLIAGGEMHKVLKHHTRFPSEDWVKFYIAQVVLGVSVLHESNIMHRDLKPGNLMLDSDGYLKLIDFGLATILRAGQKHYDGCGTPPYMAPEQIRIRDGYDFSADWWSVGIIAYEMMFGMTPFGNRRR